jgi:hypothetical protein
MTRPRAPPPPASRPPHPHWLILYGPWTRHYFAFPRFHVPPGTILAAATTPDLLALMRATEQQASPGPPPRPGGR